METTVIEGTKITRHNINDKMIGRKAKTWCTGEIAEGTITDIKALSGCWDITIQHQPIVWGNDTYTETHVYVNRYGDENLHKGYIVD
jgi:hypothetical protein